MSPSANTLRLPSTAPAPCPALHRAADEELFLQVTGYGPAADMPKIDLTRHDIDSIMIDPLKGERQSAALHMHLAVH